MSAREAALQQEIKRLEKEKAELTGIENQQLSQSFSIN